MIAGVPGGLLPGGLVLQLEPGQLAATSRIMPARARVWSGVSAVIDS